MTIESEGISIIKVSVVIVSWNHREYLAPCLEALAMQRYPDFDVIVVDNASNDGSVEWMADSYPEYQLMSLDTNTGFSKAFNMGVRSSQGEFILSLNPDVRMKPDFIANLLTAVKQDQKIGIVAPKLLRADDNRYLDSTGLFLNRQRRPYDRGQMQIDAGQFDDKNEIFGACGAAALYRRSMLDDLAIDNEYFDEDFFAYYEDADLAWRAKLRGWRSVFTPDAVAEHVRGWGDTLRKRPTVKSSGPRLALRNHYLMILKNDSLRNFLRDAVHIIFSELPRLIYMLLVRRDSLEGIRDFFRLAPKARQKRKAIQARKTITDKEHRIWFISHD